MAATPVRVDVGVLDGFADVAVGASRGEAAGCGVLWVAEAKHDPFLLLSHAAAASQTIGIGSAVAVALARNPMTVATSARDLQQLSAGRLHLGLGSQVQAHVTRRFSMPFTSPVARMREFVLAVYAIWDSWDSDRPLRFEGDYYSHTLMTPMFNPGPYESGSPPVYLAAVGPAMTEVAGEVAAGMLAHAFTSEKYIDEVTLPALEQGRANSMVDRGPATVVALPIVATGSTDDLLEESVRRARKQIAFYASTAAYQRVLMVHGWADRQPQFAELARAGRWDDMEQLVDDDMLSTFAIVAPSSALHSRAQQRFIGRAASVVLPIDAL